VSWDRPFDRPVPMPSGAAARTLRDAANYIKEMPKSERDKPEWRLVIQMMIDAAEDIGPMLFAKWAILYAVEQSFNPAVKDPCGAKAKANEVSVKGKAPALKAGASRDGSML
jgi:hypothetical protein